MTTFFDPSLIGGNATKEVKERVAFVKQMNRDMDLDGFASPILTGMNITQVSILDKVEEPFKKEAKVVCELTVKSDMCNTLQNLHGGCSAYLIDVGTTLAFVAFDKANGGEGLPGVSQSLSIVYHSPAVLGDTIRVVNTTLTVGARAMSARTEIWDDTHHRLVASGTHVKMHPSQPKAKF